MIEENKWYEKLKNKCWSCKQYDGKRFIREAGGFYHFKCRFCGYKHQRPVIKGTWETKDGKTFIDGAEVELKRTGKDEIYIGRVDNSLF